MNDEARRHIALLGLESHPEGGHYRETFRDPAGGKRAYSTAIYFLLAGGEISRWHKVDAAEVWHFYAGSPLELFVGAERHVLGASIGEGQSPQIVVPRGVWQRAKSLGNYTLAGCTVAPGFEFAGFELAPDGFEPD
jgi:predicted cupin superfamily sugar epimerase